MVELILMKVLLFSPKDPDKPGKLKFLVGGENTFTKNLLSHPPLGVNYVHYSEALRQGSIVYTGLQKPLSCLMKIRILPSDAGYQCIEVRDKFDLIHSHAYCLQLRNYSGPVILSDSSSNILFLKDYLGWSETRIKALYSLRKFLARRFDIYDQNLNIKESPLVVWSEFARKVHIELGVNPSQIVVVPPGIEKARFRIKKHQGINILFVGVWLQRKGGLLLLEAYRILKREFPNVRLTLIGELPRGVKLPKDVWQQDFVPRKKLMRETFPLTDILVLTPPVAEGYGLVVLEAASFGIPAIVSRVYALPELVEDKKTGFVITPGNLEELIKKLEILITDHSLREKMGEEAQKKFFREFWTQKTNKILLRVYQETIKGNFSFENKTWSKF